MSLQKGLVGHWTLDAGATSNGTAYDSSAYDNHGTIVSATTGANGIIGEGFSFASGDEIQTTAPLPSQSDFTISYWFSTTASVTTGNPVVSNWGNSAEGINTGVPAYNGVSGGVNIAIRDISNGDNDNLQTDNSYNDGQFHHAVVTRNYNPSAGATQLDIYIDGNDVPTTEERSQTADDLDTSGLQIGRDDWDDSSFDGTIDDVRIYNRVLSESEISALYNMRSQRQHNSKTTLVESFEYNSFDDRWSISNATISSSRQFSGTYSFGSWNEGGVEATWTLQPNGGERIDSFEYIWKEDNSQTGHVVILYDRNGDEIQESGTENPQWYLNDGSGGRFQEYGGDNYNAWTKFRFEFNWGSGNYDYRLEDLQSGTVRTGTTPLDTNAPVNEIRFTGAGYGTADYCRFDDIRINNTTI